MRAYDISVGLAVAWARRHAVLEARRMLPGARERVVACAADATIIAHAPLSWTREVHLLLRGEGVVVDRGPVVVPEPLRDHRVAFGIAMAQRGPWRRPFDLASPGHFWNGAPGKCKWTVMVQSEGLAVIVGPTGAGNFAMCTYVDLRVGRSGG